METVKMTKNLILSLTLALALALALALTSGSQAEELKVIEAATPANTTQAQSAPQAQTPEQAQAHAKLFDPLNYTLGPDDIVEIIVMRHPEFSGIYPINMEGKLQYKFVGDIDVNGMTKKQLEDKLKEIISNFVISPEVNVTVTEYKSKVFYVLGAIGNPGKYYMRSETITVREAAVLAGLPTQAAAMRKTRIITPDKKGRSRTKAVDLYAVLYAGKLNYNYEMKSGDVLYVPYTIMAKLMSVIMPVTSTVSGTATAVAGPAASKAAIAAL
jgi:protein involved in polysaccharide export with SLBB domain